MRFINLRFTYLLTVVKWPQTFLRLTTLYCNSIRGYRGGSPTAVQAYSDPALCGSHPLVTPYYCRLGDLLCFVFIVWLLYVWFLCVGLLGLYVPSVLWYCWLGLLTCKNRLPYNLYCVGGDVILLNPIQSVIAFIYTGWSKKVIPLF